jgi:hypothetical protein
MKLFAVVMACALLGACEKAGDHKAPDDYALFKDLPGGNTLLVGGNYMKLQGFMDSTLGKMTEKMMASTGTDPAAYKAWSACFIDMPHMTMAGGIKLAGALELRFAFRGMTIADVAGCAGKAGYPTKVDPDGKYVGVDVPGPGGQTMPAGYFALPDGTLLFDQQMRLGLAPTFVAGSRAQLEAIAGKLATDNATGDKHLLELAEKADHHKTFWFAGTAANTPFADKVGDAYGAFDMRDGGMAVDATIAFTDGSLAAYFADSITKAKQNDAFLPPVVKSVIDAVKIERTDGTVHVAASLTAKQLSEFAALKGVQ